jgi:adenine-specific DNA methylase
MKDRKENGVYYTPRVLAEYLARPLITANSHAILDPSYGEGSLLLAAERIFKQKNGSSEIHLFGCDTKPVNGLLKHLPEANLKEIDFFNFTSDTMFQTILMNPPYVRHQIQDLEKIKKYRILYPELSIINNSADLWAYFLIKSVSHLQKNGNIGAILPWAFLQADYAIPLRKWLADNFRKIKVVALSNKYFERADERVVVIWLKGYGQKNNSIKISASKKIKSRIAFTDLSLDNWCSDKVSYSGVKNIEQILRRYQSEFGFSNFVDHADVKIGVVTGAVDYFIVSKNDAKEIGFKRNHLIPIITSPDGFSNYLKNGEKTLPLLVTLKEKDCNTYSDYIKKGIDGGYHLRSHSQRRKPWYSIKPDKVPDAFFHYRISKTPYLLPNLRKVQCTNSFHRIYFKNINEIEKKWIAVSLLSLPSQLSLETNSKTYGRGILKIEPRALKMTLVVKRNDPIINSVYEHIIFLLSNDQKEKAMQIATEFIYKELDIPKDFERLTDKTLSVLQDLRLH